jgi:hypothetical protein
VILKLLLFRHFHRYFVLPLFVPRTSKHVENKIENLKRIMLILYKLYMFMIVMPLLY